MSATRGMLRSLAEACCSPAEVLARLNRLLVEDLPTGRFVTLVYAVFDPQKVDRDIRERRALAADFGLRRRGLFSRNRTGLAFGSRAGRVLGNLSPARSGRSIRSIQRWYYRGNESSGRRVRAGASASAPARVGRFTREPARKCSRFREWCRAQWTMHR